MPVKDSDSLRTTAAPISTTSERFFQKVHGKKRGRKPARLAYCLWLMCEAMGEQDFLTAEDMLFIRLEIEEFINGS